MVPDYYALERTAESGNKHVGWSFIPRFRTWSSIQNDIPGRNVPALNAVVTSGTSSTRGLRRRVRSPLWRSVSVSVGNRGRRPSEERERERRERKTKGAMATAELCAFLPCTSGSSPRLGVVTSSSSSSSFSPRHKLRFALIPLCFC
jgi:hypothetical protein